MSKPVIAIVGRPNVGKSTFFNRCIGKRAAIVDDSPGVTRDRVYHDAEWSGREFSLVDTGGLMLKNPDEMAGHIGDQVKLVMEESDVIVFLVDGKEGLTSADQDVANMLRKQKTPVLLAVNKIDDPKDELNAMEFYKLGLGEPLTLSAMRGSGGVGDLLDKMVELLPKLPTNGAKDAEELETEDVPEEDVGKMPFSIAIVGKPNVGKSSVTNVLCGTSRSIVSPVPGTTRDAIDTSLKIHGRELTLIDTAGIRRKSKVDYGIEAFSVVRSIQAINRADVVVLMLDAAEEITDQDQKIGAKIEEAGKACVVVMNKWDLIEDKSSSLMKEYVEEVHQQLRHLSYAEVVFTSAMTKQRVNKIIEACERAFAQSRKRVTTGLLNQVLNEAVALVPPPASKRGKRARLYYSTQVAVAPPAFVLFVNDAKLLTPSYHVYLERKLREAFGYDGVPLRLMARSKER